MKKVFIIVFCLVSIICMSSCKENYSNGEKVGNLIEFTRKGVLGFLGRQAEHDANWHEHQR